MYDDTMLNEFVVIEKMLLHIDPDTIQYMGDNVSCWAIDIATRRSGGKYINMLNHLTDDYTAAEAYNLMRDIVKQNPESAPDVIFAAVRLCNNEETFTESMQYEIFKECIRRNPSCIVYMDITNECRVYIKDSKSVVRQVVISIDVMLDHIVDEMSIVPYPVAKALTKYGVLAWLLKVPVEEQTFEMVKLVCDNCKHESEWLFYRRLMIDNKDKDIRDYIAATDIKMNYEPKE